MIKEANQREDAKSYMKLRGTFGKFQEAFKATLEPRPWLSLLSLTECTNGTMSFNIYDTISISASFSMVVNEARTKRAGRIIFSRCDGDESKIIWVIYFDEAGDVCETPYAETKAFNILEIEGMDKLIMCLCDKCEPCFEVVG